MRNSYLEEQALSLVGKDIYESFVEKYTEYILKTIGKRMKKFTIIYY